MKALIILMLMFSLSAGNAQVLENYLQEAAENNPGLKASFSAYMASMEKVPQVGALPDPELTFGYFLRPMELLMGNQRAQLSLMQMFPWFGMLRTQRNEASLMAQAKYENFREMKNQLFFEVKDTWYQLYRLQGEIAIAEENLEILRTMERIAVVRFQSGGDAEGATIPRNNRAGQSNTPNAPSGMGRGNMQNMGRQSTPAAAAGNMNMKSRSMASSGPAMVDVLRIQIEIKELENDIALLIDNQEPLKAKFNALLNRNLDEDVVLADTLLPVSVTSRQTTFTDTQLEQHPMVKMLEAEREAYQVQQGMAKLEGRPMFGLGVNYMIFSPRNDMEMATGGNNMLMPMATLTLPIFRKKYNAMGREAELNQEAIALQKENTYNELNVQWRESLKNLRDNERRINLYQEQSQLSEQALNIMIASYAANEATFEEVLSVQQQMLNYKIKLLNAVAGQYAIIASMERITASELE